MKKLMFSVLVTAAVVALGDGSAIDPKLEKSAKWLGIPVEQYAKMSPAERQAKCAEKKLSVEKMYAERCGMALEDFQKLSKEDRKTRLANAALAKQLKMSPSDFEKLTPEERKVKEDELAARREKATVSTAKRLGMSVEDYKKLTPEERKSKLAELKKGT